VPSSNHFVGITREHEISPPVGIVPLDVLNPLRAQVEAFGAEAVELAKIACAKPAPEDAALRLGIELLEMIHGERVLLESLLARLAQTFIRLCRLSVNEIHAELSQLKRLKTARHSMTAPNLKIVYRPVDALKPYPGNARQHSQKQLQQLASSIIRFGMNTPVGVGNDGEIVFGHARAIASKMAGLKTIPTVLIAHLTDNEKRAYIIADNKIAENAGWSKKALASELSLIIAADPTFDLELTGFDLGTIELLIDQDAGETAKQDEVPAAAEGPAVTLLGDRWKLGRHALVCADATKGESYVVLMGGARAQMIFSDPPYDVPIMGHASGKGKAQRREFVMASGEMEAPEYIEFLAATFDHCARHSVDGSLHYQCIDWRHQEQLHAAARRVYSELSNLCVWVKSNGGMGSMYRSRHELVTVWKRGTRPHINNVELGKHGRNRTNVWEYAGVNSFSATRDEELSWHPTVKPLPMVADAILDASRPDGLILDPFGGSGTTCLAAEKTGRQARLIELDPLYCDVIVRRFESVTGIAAVDQNGCSFRQRADAAAHVAKETVGG
jgi:DNA modification methylase